MNLLVRTARLIFFVLVFLFLAVHGNEARAERFRFQWGANLSVAQQYDDNVRLSDGGKEDDWITYVTPGIRLSLLMEETEAHLDYRFSLVGYAKNNDLSTVRHNLSLTGFKGIPITARTTLDLDNTFFISEDPLEVSEYVTSVRTTRDRYYRNTFLGRLNYLIGPEDTVYLGFGHIWLNNEDPGVEDSQEFRPLTGFNYWFTTRYGFNAEYSYALAKFERSSDHDEHVATASFVCRINPRTEANLTYLYDHLTYKDPLLDGYTVNQLTLGLSREFSDRVSGSVSAGYFGTDLTDLDDSGNFAGSLSFRWSGERASLNLDGATGYRRQFFQAENLGLSFYGRAVANFSYQLLQRLSGNLTASYLFDDFKETIPPREDSNYWATASLRYSFLTWLSGSLQYEYRQRESTEDTLDFIDNRVTLSITAFYAGMPRPL